MLAFNWWVMVGLGCLWLAVSILLVLLALTLERVIAKRQDPHHPPDPRASSWAPTHSSPDAVTPCGIRVGVHEGARGSRRRDHS